MGLRRVPREELSEEYRARIDAAVQIAQLAHDQAPWVFLYYPKVAWGVRKGIDWTPRPDRMVVLYDDFQ